MNETEHPTLSDRLLDLHAHLEATAEQPIETAASRWLGEAEAVAGDLAVMAEEGDPDEAVVAERIGHVHELLSNVDGTGDPEGDEHVAAAREEVTAVRDLIDAEGIDENDGA